MLVCLLFTESIPEINGITRAMYEGVQHTLASSWAPICQKSSYLLISVIPTWVSLVSEDMSDGTVHLATELRAC